MKISYSLYQLSPKKKLNAMDTSSKKEGVYIQAELKGKKLFADFLPHLELGDESIDEFMENFRFQKSEYERKVFDLLLKDQSFQNLRPQMFKNHALGRETTIHAPIKYKVQGPDDYGFMPYLEKRRTLRLDPNGIFSRSEFDQFLKGIDPSLLKKIEYIEDPTHDGNWKDIPVKVAKDFHEGDHADIVIHKPNARFKTDNGKTHIYSSYMGGALGTFHAYAELVHEGDLSLFHGLNTFGVYQEDIELFTGTDLLTPHQENIRKVYRDLLNREWKTLGAM